MMQAILLPWSIGSAHGMMVPLAGEGQQEEQRRAIYVLRRTFHRRERVHRLLPFEEGKRLLVKVLGLVHTDQTNLKL